MLGGSSFVSTAIALVLIAAAATCLIIPNEIDEALGGAATAISDHKEVAGQTLASVVSFTTETDDDHGLPQTAAASGATVLEHGKVLLSGDAPRTVLTSGHDTLMLEPESAITADSEPESPTTIIELLYGTLNVEAAKRSDGETLSIETPYLVATVKGTKFAVTTTDAGTAVSVTEGLVSVRSARSGDGFDIKPGYTAVVSAVHGMMPTIVATTDGGALAAIQAAVSGKVSNSNHHRP